MLESERCLVDLAQRYPMLEDCCVQILEAFRMLETCFAAGGKVLICGNGGSAADAEHLTAELMKGFERKRPAGINLRRALEENFAAEGIELYGKLQGALPTIALSTHGALCTAIINDMDASLLFAQQVLGYGKTDDVLLAISTSGDSENVLNAVKVARALGLSTIGMSGKQGRLASLCDVAVSVPAMTTTQIQELQLPVYHTLCRMLEERFFGESGPE